MSLKWSAHVFAHSRARGTARLVLLSLADRADEHGRCWPSVADIAHRANVTTGQARRLLRRLVDAGELRIVKHGGGGRAGGQRGHTNTYQLARLEPRAPAPGLGVSGPLAPVPGVDVPGALAPMHATPSAGARRPLAPVQGEPSLELSRNQEENRQDEAKPSQGPEHVPAGNGLAGEIEGDAMMLNEAVRLAQEFPPPAAADYGDGPLGRLAALCYYLACPTGTFYLSTRKAGAALGVDSGEALKLLTALIERGALEIVEPAAPGRATVYRWRGPLAAVPQGYPKMPTPEEIASMPPGALIGKKFTDENGEVVEFF